MVKNGLYFLKTYFLISVDYTSDNLLDAPFV